MNDRDFLTMLEKRQSEGSNVCVGLDVDYWNEQFIPDSRTPELAVTEHAFAVIMQTRTIAAAYKLNWAFYLQLGDDGIRILRSIVDFVRLYADCVPIILDGKFGDIGNTGKAYARTAFEIVKADAVTVNPYMGVADVTAPFLAYPGKFCYVLVKTSNPGSGELQGLSVGYTLARMFFFEEVARNAKRLGSDRLGAVVGATFPSELKLLRDNYPDMQFLVPGLGAQGGSPEAIALAGPNTIFNSSRGIVFADDPYNAAAELHNLISGSLYSQ